jgi:hypothetical protein
LHGKRVAPEKLVWAVGALAEGLGIRAVARVFEVDPNTGLGWRVAAAEQLETFARSFLCEVHSGQVHLAALYAVLRAVKDGEGSEDAAIEGLERAPQWVWGALDPVTKRLVTIDVGERPLALAQHGVHPVTQV